MKLEIVAWLILALVAVVGFGTTSLATPKGLVLGHSSKQPEGLDWNKITKSYPTYIEAYIELSHQSWLEGQTAAARQHLEQARAINPNHPKLAPLSVLIEGGGG